MSRYAWILEVRPGYEDEYKKRHDHIPPDMLEALAKAGLRNYSIFRHGLTLFGYFATISSAASRCCGTIRRMCAGAPIWRRS
jgi:L-rhamnose mutarotase